MSKRTTSTSKSRPIGMDKGVPKGASANQLTQRNVTQNATGVSLFHILTLGSIGASIALYLSGKQKAGIFVGLWPPTFQTLKLWSIREMKRFDRVRRVPSRKLKGLREGAELHTFPQK